MVCGGSGLLGSVFFAAQLTSSFLWGKAADLVGRRPVLIGGLPAWKQDGRAAPCVSRFWRRWGATHTPDTRAHAQPRPPCARPQAELKALGAGKAHLRKLRKAISQHRGVAPPARSSSQQMAPARPAVAGVTPSGKRFAAFLSHHKAAAAMDARFVKDKLEQMLGGGADVFLDSDNLQDLRQLLDHVRDSDVLVLFQACPRSVGRPLAVPQPPRGISRRIAILERHLIDGVSAVQTCVRAPTAAVTRRPGRCCSGRTASWRSTLR